MSTLYWPTLHGEPHFGVVRHALAFCQTHLSPQPPCYLSLTEQKWAAENISYQGKDTSRKTSWHGHEEPSSALLSSSDQSSWPI